jgi:hypothetical protein
MLLYDNEKNIVKHKLKKKNKREKKSCNKTYKKNREVVEKPNNISVIESLKENWLSWIVTILCVSILSYPNIFSGIFTIIIVMIMYYFVHRVQHSFGLNILSVVHHYHHETPHNFFSDFIEIVLEINFINNFFFIYLFDLFDTLFINQWVIILFTIMYITVHNINYSILRVNNVHRLHHGDVHYNHGPDVCDILFGTKHPSETTVENTNHYIPFTIVSFVFLYAMQCLWNYNADCKFYLNILIHFILISSFVICLFISVYLWFFTDFPYQSKNSKNSKNNKENSMI